MEDQEAMETDNGEYISGGAMVYYEGQLATGMHHGQGHGYGAAESMGNDDDDLSQLSQPAASEGLPPLEG
jgi:hypothetical protein